MPRVAWKLPTFENNCLPYVLANTIAAAENDHSYGYHVLDAHENIWAISDYSGMDSRSKYKTYAFLICTKEAGEFFLEEIRGDRDQLLKEDRTLSYKALNDGVKRMYLQPICDVGQSIQGHLFVFCVDKRIPVKVFYDTESHETICKATASWKVPVKNEFVLISLLLQSLVHGLCRAGQNLYWMTDNDNFTHSPKMLAECARVFTHTFVRGWETEFGSFHFGPKANFASDKAYLDLLALPDIAAGAYADFSQHFPVEPGVFPSYRDKTRGGVLQEKSLAIFKWFMSNVNVPLRRIAISVDMLDGGGYRVINLLGAARKSFISGDFVWPSPALCKGANENPGGPWFPHPDGSGVIRKFLAQHREYLEKVMPEEAR